MSKEDGGSWPTAQDFDKGDGDMEIRAGKHKKHKDNLIGYLFMAPVLLGFFAFIAFPVIASLLISFTDWNFLAGFSGIKFVGFANYAKLLSGNDAWFTPSFINTIIFTVTTVPIGLALGLIIAAFMDKYVYWSKLFRVFVFIPYIASVVASVIVWQVMLQPTYGPVNSLLHSIGMANPPKWFVDPNWALPTIIIFQIWQTLGYNVIVFMAGLKGISADLYEAAEIDGAGEVRKFFSITLPMISPTMFFLSTMGIIGSFKVFDSISVATGGGPGTATSVVAFYIYREAFQMYRLGTANAAAWIMFAVIFVVTMIQLRGQNRWVTYES
ncbi:hypothetical protein L248_1608 [Schleiferilactobacillus shenzhenensis LY-73]|uniref:ABC transmembrane type-1 domain-containing protein n=2 Tax=Schleiferilactobacillus shenzhenensis TaxID=1231337 RepID=U4TL06_9LACO|nr:hypothetical protein L248_1608 [Schleiferilactobacillus shenzhenensis LY-73]